MPELLGLARAIHVAASLSLFGSLLFHAAIAPAAIERCPVDAGRRLGERLDRLVAASLVVALVGAVVWLLLQAMAMSGARDLADVARAIAPAILETRFGHVLLARVALLLAAALCLWPSILGQRRWAIVTAVAMSGAAVVLLAATGHAAALEDTDRFVVMFAQAVHLLAAGAWLGSLAPLVLTLGLPPAAALIAARRFSPLGVACVTALAASAYFNGKALIGSIPALVGTPYGLWALTKLGLFATMLVLAAANRFLFSPDLATAHAATIARRLRLSIVAETALGLAVVMAAGMLATTPPGLHFQPWWPFPLRLSAEALQDPDRLKEVLLAAVVSGIGALLMFAGLWYRRVRWLSLATGLVLIAYVAPSFRLLAVDAFPTTFYRSPTGYSVESVAHGGRLFAAHCAACHGPGGRGDGPAAASVAIKPADLTSGHLYDHPDGDILWWISYGRASRGMPGFADMLDETARWNLVDFIRANADAARLAGLVADPWARPMPAPEFSAECPDGAVVSLREQRGRLVHVVFAGAGSARRVEQLAQIEPFRRSGGVRTVVVARDPSAAVGTRFCTAFAPEIAEAYAPFRAAAPGAAMEDTEFLIDAAGSLRAVRLPGDTRVWSDPITSDADIDALRRAPAAVPSYERQPHVH